MILIPIIVQKKNPIENIVDTIYETADIYWIDYTPLDKPMQLLWTLLPLSIYSLLCSYLPAALAYICILGYIIIFLLPLLKVSQDEWMDFGLTISYDYGMYTRAFILLMAIITLISQHIGEIYEQDIYSIVITFGYPWVCLFC